jgi:hypothetical protein
VLIIRSLGVETDASRAVNEVPTPTGVARQPQAEVFFHRGFINGFFVFETETVGGLAPLDVKCFENTASCEQSQSHFHT